MSHYRYWKRMGRTNRHHVINKCRGGKDDKMNIIYLDVERHNAWHFLFGNMDFLEVAELLRRTYRQKTRQLGA